MSWGPSSRLDLVPSGPLAAEGPTASEFPEVLVGFQTWLENPTQAAFLLEDPQQRLQSPQAGVSLGGKGHRDMRDLGAGTSGRSSQELGLN